MRMLLTLFTQLESVSVLQWKVALYHYVFLLNEGILLLLVKLTSQPFLTQFTTVRRFNMSLLIGQDQANPTAVISL